MNRSILFCSQMYCLVSFLLMILNKDVQFEERMMCILNKYKHHYRVIVLALSLIDRCHFLTLGICLSKGCKACAGGKNIS